MAVLAREGSVVVDGALNDSAVHATRVPMLACCGE
jgi:hypothetical protein